MKQRKKINRKNISNHLLEYQFNIIGKQMIDMLDDDQWNFNWTLTSEQQKEFKQYSIPLLQKIFKFRKSKAEEVFKWFILQFGLRIKN